MLLTTLVLRGRRAIAPKSIIIGRSGVWMGISIPSKQPLEENHFTVSCCSYHHEGKDEESINSNDRL